MRLRLLTTFLAVARTLNVTRASEVLHLSQSGVSEQIQALEESLDARLFVRRDRKLELTPAGITLVRYAQQILALAEEARQSIHAGSAALGGRLRIGGLETLCTQYLPELIARFTSDFPAVEIDLRTEGSQSLRNEIVSGEMDASFAFGTAGLPASCAFEVLRREPLIVVCGPAHPLRQSSSVSLEQLALERFLVTRPGCVYRGFFDSAFTSRNLPMPGIFGEFESIGLVRKLVAAGSGCALVPEIAVSEELASGALHALPLAEPLGDAELVLLWRDNRARLPLLRTFLDFVRNYASDQTSR
jgi:DNA-binding transcriptional LysR family regulator